MKLRENGGTAMSFADDFSVWRWWAAARLQVLSG